MSVEIIGSSGYIANVDINGNLYVTLSGTGGIPNPLPVKDSADMTGTTPGTAPSYTTVVGGIYNSSAPSPTNSQTLPFQMDSSGRLIVNIGAGSSGNAAASATGSAVPADADYQGLNVGGTLRGHTGVNPSGSIYAAQVDIASVLGSTLSATNPLFTEITDGTHTVTLNSTTYSSKYGLDVNLLGTLGTAFSTAGYVDIKGADGNVFVRQTTAANLNATVVGTGTFAVQDQHISAATAGYQYLTDGTHTVGINGSSYSSTYGLNVNLLGLDGAVLSASNPLISEVTDGTNILFTSSHPAYVQGTITFPASPVVYIEGHAGATLDIAQGGATAATNALQVAGVYNTSLPTLTNGQGGAISLDAKAQPLVDINYVLGAVLSKTNPLFTEISDGTNTMGAMANFGTSPGAVTAVNTNASLFIGTTVASAAASGVQKVGIVGNSGAVFDAAQGAAVPANLLVVGGSNGTDVYALNSDTSGNIGVNIKNTPSVSFAVGTSSGATPKGFHISSNAVQAIKSSGGNLYSYYLDNTANAATTYFQFFNVASGSVSLGSTSSLFVVPVPAGGAANLNMTEAWSFGTAMSFAATTTYNGSTFAANPVDCVIAYN